MKFSAKAHAWPQWSANIATTTIQCTCCNASLYKFMVSPVLRVKPPLLSKVKKKSMLPTLGHDYKLYVPGTINQLYLSYCLSWSNNYTPSNSLVLSPSKNQGDDSLGNLVPSTVTFFFLFFFQVEYYLQGKVWNNESIKWNSALPSIKRSQVRPLETGLKFSRLNNN